MATRLNGCARWIAGFALLLALCSASWAQVKLYPIDDTHKDRFFVGFVKQLKAAVGKRDVKALRKLISDDVIVADKPEKKGWKEFQAKWNPADPKSPLWSALEDMLDVGFVQEHPQIYLSPYFVWKFPDQLNPARFWVVTWGDEPLREKPDPRSREIRRLQFEVVERKTEQDRWVEVETNDSTRGWVAKASVKDPTQARAQFSFEKGQWLMVLLED
jgi:hypothetical protein